MYLFTHESGPTASNICCQDHHTQRNGIPCDNPTFLPTSVEWNLGLTWKFPIVIVLTVCSNVETV